MIGRITFIILALAVVAVAAPQRPSQPFRVTSNDPVFLNQRIDEIYKRILAYVDTLNTITADTASLAYIRAYLYDDTASQALYKAIKIHDTLWKYHDTIYAARDTAHTAYIYKDTASLALRPMIHTGRWILPAEQSLDTVIITDMSGAVVHYPCDSCFSVFISPVVYSTFVSVWLPQTANPWDSLGVAYPSSLPKMVSDSSFSVHKQYWEGGMNLPIYWMTVRRK